MRFNRRAEHERGDMVNHREVAEEFVRRLKRRYGDRIERVVLFGSVARGEARKDSDVDLLVVAPGDRFLLRRELMADVIAYLLERGVYISVKVVTPQNLEELRDTGFLRGVMEEGAILA